MTVTHLRFSVLFLTIAGALLALSACGTRLASTIGHLDGRAVEVVEAGDGGPTVVFEAGLGNDWTTWDQVASEVSVRTRVFAYSRPGYGYSESSPSRRDAAHIVEDLRALLVARGIPPPYVLVGHSFGGAYLELFARTHPEEVAGLVLVDSRHGDFGAACEEAGLEGCSISNSVRALLPSEQRAEIEGFSSTADQLRAAGPFGPHPVRVLCATSHGLPREAEVLWQTLAGSLAGAAADGELILFPGASHLLHRERPHEVAQAILSLLPVPGT